MEDTDHAYYLLCLFHLKMSNQFTTPGPLHSRKKTKKPSCKKDSRISVSSYCYHLCMDSIYEHLYTLALFFCKQFFRRAVFSKFNSHRVLSYFFLEGQSLFGVKCVMALLLEYWSKQFPKTEKNTFFSQKEMKNT